MKRAPLTFTVLLLFTGISFAQDNKIDSLKNLLRTAKEDTARVNILNTLSENLWRANDYDKAKKYADDAMQLAEKLSYEKGIANAYSNTGVVYFYKNDYPEALKNHFAALKIREEISDKKGIATSYNNIALNYYKQGNYPEALKNHFVALKMREEIGDKQAISDSYNNIGIIYAEQGNYQDALSNHLAALKIRQEIGNKKGLIASYMNIGVCYVKMENYPDGLKNYFAALKISQEIGDKKFTSLSYSNIGNVYLNQHKYNEALENLMASLKIKEEMGDRDDIAEFYNNIGLANTLLKNFTEARKYLDKGLAIAKATGSKEIISDSYTDFVELDNAIGNYKQSLEDYKLYTAYKDSMLNETNSRLVGEMKTKYETEKKDKELAALTLANELQVQKTKKRNSYILAISSLSLLILSGLWFQSYKRKKRLIISEKEIEKKNLELMNKDLLIEKTKTEERTKVQKEIGEQYHDILGSKITSLLLMCENKKNESGIPGNENEFAASVSLKAREIAETNRSGIIALDPDTEQLDSFVAKLRSDLYDMVETSGKTIHFMTPPEMPGIKIDPIIKFNLSAVMKEAINNSTKYSTTNGVTVHVEITGTRYIINVIDSGVGIDPEKKKKHSYGLRNMLNRMENIGGHCQVISKLNEGTTVRLEGDFSYTISGKEQLHPLV